jgi:UDP-N-acetylglucosamine acyltransferase
METSIHPTAVVSPLSEIGEAAEIGPFCVIEGKTRIGRGTIVESHVRIGSKTGIVEIGENNRISAGTVLGGPPQDKKYKGEPTRLVIGNNNQIREYVTISLGTPQGRQETTIGNDNLIMAYAHFGHDCFLGNANVIANLCQFAGHVHIQDKVNVGGACAVNQFVRIGSYAFIGGYSSINKDIPPFCIAQGNYAVMRATNKIGLERAAGLPPKEVENIHRAIRIISKGSGILSDAIQRIHEECHPSEQIQYLLEFIKTSQRGLAK